MVKRFGWKQETQAPKLSMRLRTPLDMPDDVSMECRIVEVLDQGDTQSCVAQATAQAMRIVMYKAGSVPPLPSRLWIYRTARETHHEGDLDNGTYISAAFKVMRELGWTSETTHPWREDNVNNPIGYGLRLHANDQKTAAREYALINGYKDGIKDALSTGYPIVFGVRVDSAFLDVTSRNPVEITGDPIGGHAMCAIGYNKGGVLLVNSWGTGWGDHGIGCIGWSTFLSKCVDLRAVELCARATS